MIIWAVYPNIRGALVVIEHNKISHVVRMPVAQCNKTKIVSKKINVYKLNNILSKLPSPDKSIIELPIVGNNSTRLTVASLFQSVGIAQGILSSHCDDIHYVNPRMWRSKYNLIKKTKLDSIEAANKIYPELKIELVKDADVSEAALIGHWFLKYSGVFI